MRTTRTRSEWRWVILAAVACLPAVALRFSEAGVEPALASLVYGVAIVGAAFLLSWAAEAAQVDIPSALAIAILAIITILPEYSVEAVLAWKAGNAFAVNPGAPEIGYVAANVTGANRLLIGLGWPVVVLAFWLRRRHPLVAVHGLPLEMTVLLVATLLTLLVLVTRSVPLWLAAVLIGVYLWYLWSSSRGKSAEDLEIAGPAALIGGLSPLRRRSMVLSLFVYSAAVIVVAAEPFVEGLIHTGLKLGVDEFMLIQWLAPLASEAPEMIVATLYALRINPVIGIRALISASVNQMTVLIGSMPVVFSLALGQAHSFPLGSRQLEEFLLTASLSLFAIVLFARMRLTPWHALGLLAFFFAHLFFPDEGQRLVASYVLLGLTAITLARDPGRAKALFSMARSVLRRVPSGQV
ncbi:MAG: Sodium:proton exchanger [Dehalococcoidia bacterium]|nr:Sodium:proton exchanger [Dehalococcoidia bacterium]